MSREDVCSVSAGSPDSGQLFLHILPAAAGIVLPEKHGYNSGQHNPRRSSPLRFSSVHRRIVHRGLVLCFALLCLTLLPCFCLSVSYAQEIPDPAECLVRDLLNTQRERQKDVWVLSVMSAEPEDITLDGQTLTFTLPDFNPCLDQLGRYAKAEDQGAWREQMLASIARHRQTFSLTVSPDGKLSSKQVTAFENAVKSAVNQTKRALTGTDCTTALTDFFFCSPTTDRKVSAASLLHPSDAFADFLCTHACFEGLTPLSLSPIFYAQRNVRLQFRNGPHAVTLSWDGVSPEKLVDGTCDALFSEIAALPAASRPGLDTLPTRFQERLADTSLALFKKRFLSLSATVDLCTLAQGELPEGYTAYFARYDPDRALDRLLSSVPQFPDEPSQALPRTGKVSAGAVKGRSVQVQVPEDGLPTYVQLRDADTNVILADAFIAPGRNFNLKVPEGACIVQYASGPAWYGFDLLFGPLGSYTGSDDFMVAKKAWKLIAGQEQSGIVLHSISSSDFSAAQDLSIHIQGALLSDLTLDADAFPDHHEVLAGMNSLTGLPAEDVSYTPILMVLDNAEDAYPHWGVSEADLLMQIPNAGSGATKLLALFASSYPEQAGPVRSGRASMLPIALSFNAAFAFAGTPSITGGNVDLDALMSTWKMSSTHRVYNLLHNNGFRERVSYRASGHNLSCHVAAIHENLLKQNVAFEERPFLFTDTPRTDGASARIIRVLHHGESAQTASNSASRSVFRYSPETNRYSRTNSSGPYLDAATGEEVTFANVIVLRVRFGWEQNYVFLNRHLVGSGCAEIFQCGRYVRGAWMRKEVGGRLILTDDKGSELELQRGVTFIVVTNEVTEVIYAP